MIDPHPGSPVALEPYHEELCLQAETWGQGASHTTCFLSVSLSFIPVNLGHVGECFSKCNLGNPSIKITWGSLLTGIFLAPTPGSCADTEYFKKTFPSMSGTDTIEGISVHCIPMPFLLGLSDTLFL